MSSVNFILPNQLFKNFQLSNEFPTYLIEEHLFFKELNFHKQKLAYHRATLKEYESFLIVKKFNVNYIETNSNLSDIRNLISHLSERKINLPFLKYLNISYKQLNCIIFYSEIKFEISMVFSYISHISYFHTQNH